MARVLLAAVFALALIAAPTHAQGSGIEVNIQPPDGGKQVSIVTTDVAECLTTLGGSEGGGAAAASGSGAGFAAFGLAVRGLAARGLAAFGAAFPAVRVAGFFGGVAMNGSVLDRRGAASPFLAAT